MVFSFAVLDDVRGSVSRAGLRVSGFPYAAREPTRVTAAAAAGTWLPVLP